MRKGRGRFRGRLPDGLDDLAAHNLIPFKSHHEALDDWTRIQDGVYDCRRGTNVIRVIVAGQLPREEHNAPLHLFSAHGERVGYGARHYQRRSPHTSSVLEQLFQGYQGEGANMPYTMQDFARDYAKEHFPQLTTEERRECLARLSAAERHELFMGLPAAEQRELAEELLNLLPRKEIEKFLKRRK